VNRPNFGSEEGVTWSDRAVLRRNCAAGRRGEGGMDGIELVLRRNCAAGRRGEGGMDGIELWSRGARLDGGAKGRVLPLSSCRSPLSFSLLSPPLRCHPPFPPASGSGTRGPGQRGPPRGAAALLSLLRLRSFSSGLGSEQTCGREYGRGSTCQRMWLYWQNAGAEPLVVTLLLQSL
jgi:hypothetical protein